MARFIVENLPVAASKLKNAVRRHKDMLFQEKQFFLKFFLKFNLKSIQQNYTYYFNGHNSGKTNVVHNILKLYRKKSLTVS